MPYILGVNFATSDAAMRVCGGARSWERAAAGIRAAPAEGFRVRLPAALEPERFSELEPFTAFLD
ncbi:hypothetical protein [Pseudonocardia sp. GCM10023141]|uniref:hypothetical protein n=1 Tax=Pseudonocardia sp. GCM10023141 TaxID=3252653 RepID=UPI00360D375C